MKGQEKVRVYMQTWACWLSDINSLFAPVPVFGGFSLCWPFILEYHQHEHSRQCMCLSELHKYFRHILDKYSPERAARVHTARRPLDLSLRARDRRFTIIKVSFWLRLLYLGATELVWTGEGEERERRAAERFLVPQKRTPFVSSTSLRLYCFGRRAGS